jgi:hypothetical protein
MANNSDDYIPLSENEESRHSSDENVEITPVPLAKKKRGRPAKSSKALGKQKAISADEESLTAPESSSQTSFDDSNPFVQTPVPAVKPQIKCSWVWNYYIKKSNDKGEMRAYCQFVLDNGEKCSKNYKYDGSTGNLNYHIIKHGIIPPTESIMPENNPKPTQPALNNIGQKEKEKSTLRWILLTTQPLSTVTQKAYIEHMKIIDSQFTVPGEKKIRMMITCSYGYNKDKLKLLLKTAQSISLTTDLWSSRSKHGYLGLTATWINKEFEIMDVLLEISYFPTPHNARSITGAIKRAIRKWEIEDQVVSITTDNGANMVAAVRDLTPIKRLSCAAHTLQLAIGKGLKVVDGLVSCAKQLINFFSTQKQIERLIKVQKEIGYEEPLHLIQDISTRY